MYVFYYSGLEAVDAHTTSINGLKPFSDLNVIAQVRTSRPSLAWQGSCGIAKEERGAQGHPHVLSELAVHVIG